MKYYSIDYSTNPKIVGTQYPQVWDFVQGYNPEPEAQGIFSLYNMYNEGFPDQNLNLSGLKLANGAKYTDFISSGLGGDYLMIISPDAKSIFEKVKIEQHQIYPCKISSLRKKNIMDYYIMKVKSNNFDYIDFKHSVFVQEGRYLGEFRSQVLIESADDFYLKEKEVAKNTNWEDCIQSSSIKMLPTFYDLGLDLFKISRVDNRWYISSKLYDMIKLAKLTGLEFDEVNL